MPCAARSQRLQLSWKATSAKASNLQRLKPISNHQLEQNQDRAQLSAPPPKGVAPLAGDGVVREPLADRRLDRPFCTNRIVYAEFGAVVHAEIELVQISRQMGWADVLIGAD